MFAEPLLFLYISPLHAHSAPSTIFIFAFGNVAYISGGGLVYALCCSFIYVYN